jgi:hypothetical protein
MKIIDKLSELKDRMVYKIIERSNDVNIEDDIMVSYVKYIQRTAYTVVFKPIDGDIELLLNPDSYVEEGQITLSKNQWISFEIDPEDYPEYYV